MGNDKDPDIIDISDEIKDVIPVEEATEDAKPAEGADGIVDVNDAEGGVATVKKVKKKKKSNNISKKPEQDVSVRQFRTGKKKGLKKALIILAVILLIVGFIVYKVVQAKKALDELMANNTVQTAQIERMDISSTINTTGTIQSKDVRTLTSPLAGVKIDKVNYKVGDMVNEGAIVVAFSVDDINKKIGQLEEDITEAKQAKALDSGDRTNTYVNGYDLQNYSVAMAYDALQKADTDLQKAKNDLQKACDEKGEFKALHEEAKEKIGEVQRDYQEKSTDLMNKKAAPNPDWDEIGKLANEVDRLTAKLAKYKDAIDNYDKNIETYEKAEETAQKAVDSAQRTYDAAWVDFNKKGYDASFSDAKSDYNLNKGNLTANDNVKNLDRQKEQSEDSLENYIVTSPITGLVTAVNAQEGNGYQATTGALMTIQAVDVLEVSTQVDEYDINNVKVGQNVVIMTDATGEDEFEGKVTFVAPTATAAQGNATSNTFEVKIDIVNKDERLRLGMSAKLNILVDTHEDVLAVPYDAIEQKDDGQTYIYVTEESTPGSKSADDGKKEILGIEVVGKDGTSKPLGDNSTSSGTGSTLPADAKGNAKEILVKTGLEGDFYTEVTSPEIREGMTVLVDSKAGQLQNDMEAFMGL